eukprot:gene12221-10997_t
MSIPSLPDFITDDGFRREKADIPKLFISGSRLWVAAHGAWDTADLPSGALWCERSSSRGLLRYGADRWAEALRLQALNGDDVAAWRFERG